MLLDGFDKKTELITSFEPVDENPIGAIKGPANVEYCFESIPVQRERKEGTFYCRFAYNINKKRFFRLYTNPNVISKRKAEYVKEFQLKYFPRIVERAEEEYKKDPGYTPEELPMALTFPLVCKKAENEALKTEQKEEKEKESNDNNTTDEMSKSKEKEKEKEENIGSNNNEHSENDIEMKEKEKESSNNDFFSPKSKKASKTESTTTTTVQKKQTNTNTTPKKGIKRNSDDNNNTTNNNSSTKRVKTNDEDNNNNNNNNNTASLTEQIIGPAAIMDAFRRGKEDKEVVGAYVLCIHGYDAATGSPKPRVRKVLKVVSGLYTPCSGCKCSWGIVVGCEDVAETEAVCRVSQLLEPAEVNPRVVNAAVRKYVKLAEM